MDIRKKLQSNEILILDGSMGAVVMQMGYAPADILKLNITQPDAIKNIHRGYLNAGCDVIISNTFDLRKPIAEKIGFSMEEIIDAALVNANSVKAEFDNKAVAFGLSPSGEMSYDKAYELYKFQIEKALSHSDIDMVILETTGLLSDVKAAHEACRSTCDKPFFASMTFCSDERTWFGVQLDEYIEFVNKTDIDAIGINCTLTPDEMLPMALKLKSETNKPVFAEPNRGQPIQTENGLIMYQTSADEFAHSLAKFKYNGINILGGCCGADAECMAKLVNEVK